MQVREESYVVLRWRKLDFSVPKSLDNCFTAGQGGWSQSPGLASRSGDGLIQQKEKKGTGLALKLKLGLKHNTCFFC